MARFGVDLYDVYRGEVPPSKALRLLRWTAPDSAFRASLAGGPEHIGWAPSTPTRVLADVWDLLSAVHTPQGKKVTTHPRSGARKGGVSLARMMSDRMGKGRGDA